MKTKELTVQTWTATLLRLPLLLHLLPETAMASERCLQ
jgi:hypothetical protein